MLISWKIERVVPIVSLQIIAAMFCVPGIILIIEDSSRKSQGVHDEAMNTVSFIGPMLLIFGLVFFVLSLGLLWYTEKVLRPAQVQNQTFSQTQPDSVYAIEEQIPTGETPRDGFSYAPRFDDDVRAYDNQAMNFQSQTQNCAPGGPQPSEYSIDDPNHVGYRHEQALDDIIDAHKLSYPDQDLADGTGSYMYGPMG